MGSGMTNPSTAPAAGSTASTTASPEVQKLEQEEAELNANLTNSETALNDTEDLITTSEAGDTLMQDVIDKINNQTGDTDSLRIKRSAPVVWECSQFSDEVAAWQSQAANLADMDK